MIGPLPSLARRCSPFDIVFQSIECQTPELLVAWRVLRVPLFAHAHALFEELVLHRVARKSNRRPEVCARGFVPSAANLKLAKARPSKTDMQ